MVVASTISPITPIFLRDTRLLASWLDCIPYEATMPVTFPLMEILMLLRGVVLKSPLLDWRKKHPKLNTPSVGPHLQNIIVSYAKCFDGKVKGLCAHV
jgi:hypothetical protein